MHKIDGGGHVNGQFVSEDAATGRAPTVVTPEWLNAVQGELAAVVTAAGLALDKNNSAQVLAALQTGLINRVAALDKSLKYRPAVVAQCAALVEA